MIIRMRVDGLIKPAHISRVAIHDEYFLWLCDRVNANQEDRSYLLLLRDLHRKDFRWSVPNDDNRAFEGKDLREDFCGEFNIAYFPTQFDYEVSMLEVIVALAVRCESIMADMDENIPMREWFWKLLSNVGLTKFTDEMYYDHGGTSEVDRILERIIERTYHRNGKGGLFPLKFAKEDQRKVELWYQMSVYLVDNYYKDDINV